MGTDVAVRGGVLREAFDYPLSRMDPTAGAHIDPACCALYETVLTLDAEGQLAPGLADGWRISDDGRTWRLHIRPDARFHSGDICDAEAVAAAFNRHRDPVEGRTGLFHWHPVRDIRAEGADVVAIDLLHPCARLPAVLRSWHACIHGERVRADSGDRFGHDVVDGTGPFRLAFAGPDRVRVERWEGFSGSDALWFENPGAAFLDAIEWLPILDARDRAQALIDGRVDCVQNPAPEMVPELQAHPDLEVIEFPQRANTYLGLNFSRHDLGFDDVRVRRAFSHAVDRQALVDGAVAGHGAPTATIVGPAFEYYDASVDALNTFDPARSAALFEEAGWGLGADGVRTRDGVRLSIPLVGQEDPVHRRTIELLREMLVCVGVEITDIRLGKPFQPFLDLVTAQPAAFVSKWLWPDVFEAVQGFTASWGRPSPNWQQADLPELDAAFEAWWHATDEAELRRAAATALRVGAEQLPLIPLYTPNTIWVHHRRVHGWRPTAPNLYPFYNDVWLEPA